MRLDVVTSGASARSLQQVAAGVANIGSSSMVDTVRAIDAGAEVKIFTNSLAVGTHSLIAAKNIKTIEALKGKRVMTGGQNDITNLWWKAAARHHGLDPDKDVELLFSGSTGNRMSALFAGGIDATVLSTPQSFKAIEAGWTDSWADCALSRRIPDDDMARQRRLGESQREGARRVRQSAQ